MEEVSVVPAGTVMATTTASSAFAFNDNMAQGLALFINVSAASGTPSMTVQLQARNPLSGNWVNVNGAVTAAITAIGDTMLVVHPAVTAVANQVVSGCITNTMRVNCTISGGTPSLTLGITAQALR